MEAVIPGAQRPLTTYIAGNPGKGKSSLIQRMALEDIRKGRGVCVIDPTGDLVSRLIHWMPRNRVVRDEVIYFNTDNPVPIDFFSYNRDRPAERQVLSDQLLDIFNLENAPVSRPKLGRIIGTLLDANDNPKMPDDLRCSFLDIEHFIRDADRRDQILSYCEHRRKRWTPFPGLTEFNSITERMSPFFESSTLETMLGARKPLLNIAEVMETGKVLLVDLKDTPTDFFVGSLIAAKIQQATFARRYIDEAKRRPFYLYIDECQTVMKFSEGSFEQILVRARKYKLCLIMANQLTSSLPKGILQKLGTIDNKVVFKLHANDAQEFKTEITPLEIEAITELQPFQAIAVMGGKVRRIKTPQYLGPSPASYAKYIKKRTGDNYSCNSSVVRQDKKHERRTKGAKPEAEFRRPPGLLPPLQNDKSDDNDSR